MVVAASSQVPATTCASVAWVLLLSASCSRMNDSQSLGQASADGGTAGRGPAGPPSLGDVMVQIARRFEVAGRAGVANRFQLAEFEVLEIEELFDDDVARATLPKEGPTAHIPAMAQAFRNTQAPELARAAAASDRQAFAIAFQRAAATCNACHQASGKGFIQVPSVPGKSVPDLDPLPAVDP
jgi:cytochrome c553